ncbi:MAG: M28 family peptidase [Bryobacterales bacterium]|nr:M28 family peptidase [Bryobacterales bacterium]
MAAFLVAGAMPAAERRSRAPQAAPVAEFSGESALQFTAKAVSFGPRPAGSAANRRLQDYIHSQLKLRRCQVIDDPFVARTPAGRIAMNNIIARFPGSSGRAVAISGHFDTKDMPGIRFVGANDGGSSTGLLLEFARILAARRYSDDVYLIWFDGEEAFGEWSPVNGVFGSRHLADRWAANGTLSRLKALINVDMIGDKDLGILQESNSTPWLRERVWKVAGEFGYGRYFLQFGGPVEDDHAPFLARGVAALDLIDFDYGPGNAWWHTAADTMDKLSAHSLEVVGRVLVEALTRL